MLLVMLLIGRLIPKSSTVTGGLLIAELLMCTSPNRASFTTVGLKRWVSLNPKNRVLTGNVYGKFRSDAAMLPPSEACNPPAPNGSNVCEFEKKNRAEILSEPP